jgi:ribokinase
MSERGPVVCVGAHVQGLFMHVERVPGEGESVIGRGYREPRDGGKVANVAVAAARFGAPTALVTVIGTDDRSSDWLGYFADERVDTSGIVRCEGPMDVGPALLPPSKIPAMVTIRDLSSRLDGSLVREQAGVIRAASIVMCALESPVDGVTEAFRLAKESDAITVLNPSPVIGIDEELWGLIDILVANEHEAAVLAGIETVDPAWAADAIRRVRSVPTVITTAGPDGAFVAADDADVVHVAAPSVDAVDTSGAGDAFVGALAALLREDEPLLEAVGAAVAAASLSCTKEHTMSSYPSRPEVDAFASKVRGRPTP